MGRGTGRGTAIGTGIGISEEHRALAHSVRGWLTRAAPPGEVRELLDAGSPAAPGVRPAHWKALVAQGLTGVHLPEGYGGGGGGLLDLAVVLEEAAYASLPGPYLATTLTSAVLHQVVAAGAAAGHRSSAAGAGRSAGGRAPVTAEALVGVVRELAAGDRTAALALAPGTLTATPVEGGHRLDGTAPPVLSADAADLLLLPAAAPDGERWFLVDAGAGGLTVRPHRSVDPTRPTAEVRADAVHVPADRAVPVADPGLVRDLAAVLLAADACGTAARSLDTAVAHAAVREQFGRPIGAFQAVKHLCADMLVRLEQARAVTWDAARAADEAAGAEGAGGEETGAEATRADARGLTAALAAATAPEAAYTCAKDAIQILGGIGFTWEHDAHLQLRRAVLARQLLGPADAHRLRAARLAEAGARRELALELPAEGARHRAEARPHLAVARGLAPREARRALAATGYAAPHLPAPYGLDAGPVQQLAIEEELREQGIRIGDLSIATWVVPSLIAYGTAEQRERYLPATLRGDLQWCQLFSEPDAGSDLAALRTRAVRTDEGWRITGQKVWTSAARTADHGILLARTDPDAPRHRGLTYFLVDMKRARGIDIRPLREITGESLFNEVYFDDVLLPADAVVGEVGGGWRVARHTLGNERVHMADQMTFDTGLEALIARSAGLGETVRARIGALAAEAHALACIGLRATLQQVSGGEPGAGASVRKLVQTLHQQRVAELTLELLGPQGAVDEPAAGERALHGFLMSRCLTIAGGTTQIQLNVVAERVLGLPRD
ncbi:MULTISPECIES: acyl-CoA dehydrogenase [unclassified Streptomyces]|uniref:acyl-CoA dehydrogenase n=1 Tax=unclassified Streptomyces TaxID=2593676 RepID=UPI000B50125C|nr:MULTISPECIES: acyl-CoA dehydrogenase [unclassified Streptomyces]MYX03533.1 acyl-CoA dehydrogenase [Streptomyces sp. SID8378]SNB84856.1 Acyl-CoA dehydrogenase [Streptomyces sp. PgraA7]